MGRFKGRQGQDRERWRRQATKRRQQEQDTRLQSVFGVDDKVQRRQERDEGIGWFGRGMG